ncbi:MAG TPA: CHC2 zinc finger domain-containing protein, partial [Bacilli bacterium]|nr:CHC2 zinc finger domain-containing protein [Bacilli bacterium]
MKDFKTQTDEILQKVSIIDVINNYVELKKSGKNYFGLCPFHDDTNPSMSVSEDKKIFKCFSCGETGNAITFVQKIENISFMQALQKVAKTVGIDINVSENPQEQVNRKYYQIMHKATEFYKFVLHNAKDGQNALKYLY